MVNPRPSAQKIKANMKRLDAAANKEKAKVKRAAKRKATSGKGADAKANSGSGSKAAPALSVYGGQGMADMDDLDPPTELE